MNTQTQILILLAAMAVVIALLAVAVLLLSRRVASLSNRDVLARCDDLRRELGESQRALRQELSARNADSIGSLGNLLRGGQQSLEQRFGTFALEQEQKLENIRLTMEHRLTAIQTDNNSKLDQMRQVVDEKLQKTLEERMTQSFRLVNERLEQVYKGLGEMQTLAVGVGDLKKVLSNVKTRGVLGEIQLGAILEEILAPEQYVVNAVTKRGSRCFVEYAVKLPTERGEPLYLPIDSKFPADAYRQLRDAQDSGDPAAVQAAGAALDARVRAFAKDIRDKYLDPPNTTEFGIMFLPFEGLYAEVVSRGLLEVLQREYRISVAGPSTMAALLNSLQMGFRAFAIQKRSSEVWTVLGAVKTEFEKFADALAATQSRLDQASTELDRLVGVRTRQIQRKLKDVSSLTDVAARELLERDGEEGDPSDS